MKFKKNWEFILGKLLGKEQYFASIEIKPSNLEHYATFTINQKFSELQKFPVSNWLIYKKN